MQMAQGRKPLTFQDIRMSPTAGYAKWKMPGGQINWPAPQLSNKIELFVRATVRIRILFQGQRRRSKKKCFWWRRLRENVSYLSLYKAYSGPDA